MADNEVGQDQARPSADQVIDDVAKGVKAAVHADPKPFFKSKTFWLNAIGLGANYFGYLPDKYAVPVGAVANIAVRILTKQPIGLGF